MEKRSASKEITPEQKALLDKGWEEIGKSIAMAVVHGGKTQAWAWSTLKPIGLYEHWMFLEWLKRCRKEYPTKSSTQKRTPGRPKKVTFKGNKSIFNSAEEVREALKLLGEGVDPKVIIEMYSDRSDK